MRRAVWVIGILAVSAITGAAVGQEGEEIVTNADVVTLTEAGLSASAIVAVIESRRTDFDTSVAQLAALSRAGVDSAVIEAMTRASAAARRPQAGADAAVSTGGGSAVPSPQPGAAQGTPSAPALQAGQTFSDALSSGGRGPEMVVIPAGSFRMGCVSGRDCGDSELPVHDVTIPQAFAVSKHEVTFEDYDRFTYPNRVDDEGWGRGRRPVINVSWNDARDYVAWLSRQTGHTYRLLSEAEWEYVARAALDCVQLGRRHRLQQGQLRRWGRGWHLWRSVGSHRAGGLVPGQRVRGSRHARQCT